MITKNPEEIEKKQSFTTEQIQKNLLALQKYDVTDSEQINQLRIEESERLKNSYIQSIKVSDSFKEEVYKQLSDLKDVTVLVTNSPHQMKLGEKSSWEMEQKNKYPIRTAIQRLKKEKETSITENLSDIDRESTTFMILSTFIKGYTTTKNGKILKNQSENKEFDCGFIESYLSDNKEERNVYLQQFTDELLEYEMSENIFDDTYLKSHADELVRMYEKLSCFPILMKENSEFFDNLDDVTKQLIGIRLENIQYEYCSMLKYRMGANGIRIDDGKEIDDISIINTYSEADLQTREGFKNNLAHMEELQQALFIESFEERVKNNIETNIDLEEVEDLKKVRELFSDYPELYAKHKDFFENVYQKYYRITDSLSYVYAEEQAHKNVWNDYKNENNHGHRILSNLIENRLKNIDVKKIIIKKDLEDFKELIHYVIGRTPILTNDAKSIAEQENLIEEVKILQDERLENEFVDMSELEIVAKTNKKINENLKKDAFRYGIPQLQAMRHIIQEQAKVSLAEVDKMLNNGNGRLLCKQSEHYFYILSKENMSGKLTELYQIHKEFVNTCQSMSEKLQKGNKIEQNLAASLGYIAMKAMTNASMSANIMAEYRYLSVIEEKKGSVVQLMNWDAMGVMYGSLEKSDSKRILIDKKDEVILRLDTLLRVKAKNGNIEYKDDKEFLGILQTCSAYENFMEQAYIPPCTTEKEQEIYKLVIEDLSKKLLAYNDRISILTIRYLDRYSDNPKKKEICRILEKTVLYRNGDNSSFERVAELAYRLRHNGFQDVEFNENYTNKRLTEALTATKFEEVTLGTDYIKPNAGQISEVWIPKNVKQDEKNYIYRKGYTYRNAKKNEIIDFDEAKGGIVGFETTQGRVIDTHKASRDVAVHLVDNIFQAGVIANAEYTIIKDGKKTDTVSTKMEYAKGIPARHIKTTFTTGLTAGSSKYKWVNLSLPENMKKIYWLQVIDMICGSVDRHRDNFFIESDENGKITSLTGIDNDMSFGKNVRPFVKREDVLSYIAEATGNSFKMNLYTPVLENAFACIPKDICDKVMKLQPIRLADELRGYIRDSELEMAVERLNALKRHFGVLKKAGKVYDLSKDEDVHECTILTSEKAMLCRENFTDTFSNYFSLLSINAIA